jgi:hypothetical protein
LFKFFFSSKLSKKKDARNCFNTPTQLKEKTLGAIRKVWLRVELCDSMVVMLKHHLSDETDAFGCNQTLLLRLPPRKFPKNAEGDEVVIFPMGPGL